MEDEQYVAIYGYIYIRARNLSSWINEIEDICIS